MSDRDSAVTGPPRTFLPLILLLFVGSGCAALIYEVVWFQLLQLVIGSSSVSLGVLLATFMGGMCFGSLLLPKYVDAKHHPLKVYAYLETGIGVMGLLLLFGMPLVNGIYVWIGGGHVAVRAIVAGICLLPPTFMMGATLPAVARWVQTTPSGVAWLGYFYGGNIAGAVIGSLLAGFYLLRVYDMAIATYVAVVLNLAVAGLGIVLARATKYEPVKPDRGSAKRAEGVRSIYAAIALSGFTALAAQVLWTRLLSLTFGATVYTFSLILGCFLFGLGIGSTVGASLARTTPNARAALGWCQILLCAAVAWAAYMLMGSMPFWPINPLIQGDPWVQLQLDLVRCLWVVLPASLLWGASFPLALAASSVPGQDPGRVVGEVYAANTVGAIFGSGLTGLVLVPWLGTQTTMQVLIFLSAISSLMLLAPVVAGESGRGQLNWGPTLLLVAATAGAGLLVRSVPELPRILVAYGRFSATWVGQNDIFYAAEGVNASVAVSRTPQGVLNYHNAGKVQASSEPQDTRLERMLGHLTTVTHKTPAKVFVIGCGAGVTAGAVSIDPGVKELRIAEIEPLVPRVVATYFSEHNFNVVNSPKVRMHMDDARHFLLTTNETYDAITSDPLDQWVKGSATLYTREFLQVIKRRLNPGGSLTLWVHLYETDAITVKSEIATFLEAFPNGAVFANLNQGQGYDLVLWGARDGEPIDIDAVQARLNDPANEPLARSLRDVGFPTAIELFSTYSGSARDLKNWMADGIINTDRNLKVQYLGGLALNQYQGDTLYRGMVRDVVYPEGLFKGSSETLSALRARIRAQLGR